VVPFNGVMGAVDTIGSGNGRGNGSCRRDARVVPLDCVIGDVDSSGCGGVVDARVVPFNGVMGAFEWIDGFFGSRTGDREVLLPSDARVVLCNGVMGAG
jgi:hypothetical protein